MTAYYSTGPSEVVHSSSSTLVHPLYSCNTLDQVALLVIFSPIVARRATLPSPNFAVILSSSLKSCQIMLQAVVLAIGVLLAAVILKTIRQYYALKDFGGPWGVGFSRLWLLWANGSGKMNLVFTQVNDRYGMFISCSLVCC